ncbi:MAG: hypothetical protein K6T80_00565 [Firmicutes bacterium]|nr:hypothetical protein [Bacillota bacterium]
MTVMETAQLSAEVPSLLFFDSGEEYPEDGNFECRFDGGELRPAESNPAGIVAVITAALLAGGLIGPGSVVTAARPARVLSRWRMAGLTGLMNGRDLTLFR